MISFPLIYLIENYYYLIFSLKLPGRPAPWKQWRMTVWHLQPYGLYGAHMDIDNSQPAWPDEALPTTRIVKKALFHIFFTHLIGAASTEQFETMRLHTGLSETMWSGLSCMQPHRFATQPRLRSALECCSRTVVVLKLRRTTGVKV